MTAAGFTYAVADNGSGTAGVLDLHTVTFANYDVIVVASDFGGWLHQEELDVLNLRAGDLASYVSHGGGLVAFAESGFSGLTTTGRFGFLPCLNEIAANAAESGFQLTPIGQALGLVTTDVNGNAYHNVFSSPCGMDVVDFDPAGRPVTLTSTGVSRSWNIAHDFQLAPNQANPSNGGVWSYLQGSNPLDPSTYTKLPNFTSQAYSIAGLQQWTGTFLSGGRADDMLPAAGVNASGASQHPLTFVWPNGVFRVHPWTPAVVVGWTSPFTGTVHVEGAVTHLDQVCGDGVRWNVLSGSTKLASGQVTFGALAGQFLSEGTGGSSLNQISVTTGQSLYFVVDAGAQGNFSCDSTALDVTVVEGPALITRPLPPATTLLIQPASIGATVGQAVNLTVAAMDGVGAPVPGVPVLVSVSGPNSLSQQVSTDAAGLARVSYVSAAAGTDLVTATANMAGRLTVSNTTAVTWTVPGSNPNVLPPTITAPLPADGTIVTKPVPITATIAPPSGQTIASWSVTYQALDPEPIVTLASGTGAPPSPLATFDPTLLANDTYAITITSTASGGGIQTLTITVAVSGNLKLGRYVTTYEDLNVSVNGFQMQVRRTYDSTDKRVGDFGIGWHVDLVNFRVSANRQLGAGGWTEYPTSCILGLCSYGFKTSTRHFVTVTFPDQHQEIFDFTPQGGSGILYWQGNAGFTARAGTANNSTLEVAGDTSLSYDFAGNLVGSSGFYNPTRFKLTTHDGRVLILDTTVGLVSETDRSGNSLTVDNGGVHASNGASISYARDNLNRITQMSGPAASQVFKYAYSPQGDLQSFTDANNNVTTFAYDSSHLLQSATGGGKPLQALRYDAANRLVGVTDANGNTTAVSNAVAAQQQVVTDPLGLLATTFTYDDLGDVLRKDNIFGGTTLSTIFTYDAVGRPLSLKDPLGNTSRFEYDATGDLITSIDQVGRIWRFTYNALGQLLTEKDPGDAISTLTYDTNGFTSRLERNDKSAYLYGHDSRGHLTSTTDPANRAVAYLYDSAGHLASIKDGAGNTSFITMNLAGQVTAMTDSLGNTTTYGYDGNGNLVSIKDARNNTWTFGYDYLNRRTLQTDPAGHATAYVYDGNGRLLSTTNPDGQAANYAYDADGRLVTRSLTNGDITNIGYDPLGKMTSLANGNSQIAISYDADGHLIGQTTSGTTSSPQPSVTLAYTVDGTGNRLTMSAPDGKTTYGYDSTPRLTSVIDPAGQPFTLGYDGISRQTSLARPNGITDTLTYSAADDLLSRVASLGATTTVSTAYAYDPRAQRSAMTDQGGTNGYTYDTAGRLTAATHPSGGFGAEAYSYDGAGNRVSAGSAALAYDAADRLTAAPNTSYTFTLNGELASQTVGTAITTYDWNSLHQLLAIHFPDGTTTTYRYDPLGRRIEVNANGQITRYVYDKYNIHLEYDGSNTLIASYTGTPNLDDVLEMVRGGTRFFYLQDGLQSTRALTDVSGKVVATYAYDAFGRQSSTGTVTNPFTFTGREYDAKSGLYYYRSRYYDPAIGRFLSVDPVDAVNPYPYADNSPTNRVDPNGTNAVEYWALVNALTPVFIGQASSLGSIVQCLGIQLLPLNAALAGMGGSVRNAEGNGGYRALGGLKNMTSALALVADVASGDAVGTGLAAGDLGTQGLGSDLGKPSAAGSLASETQNTANAANTWLGWFNLYTYLKSIIDLAHGGGDCNT
jgi:RHS repeat-associated protein